MRDVLHIHPKSSIPYFPPSRMSRNCSEVNEKMITMVPIRCKDCIHLRGKFEGDVRVMDQCYVYDREITDEMLDEPCKFHCKPFKAE